MFGRLVRFLLIVIILVGALAYLGGYWQPEFLPPAPTTAGSRQIDAEAAKTRAREAGREISSRASEAAKQLEEGFSDGALTAKIKSKMALDDMVDARAIGVSTKDRVVTLTGTVTTARERERAVQLATETNGVTRVDDKLTTKQP